ncbi:unnamed protein product, partial [Closterium sp. NIES-53]
MFVAFSAGGACGNKGSGNGSSRETLRIPHPPLKSPLPSLSPTLPSFSPHPLSPLKSPLSPRLPHSPLIFPALPPSSAFSPNFLCSFLISPALPIPHSPPLPPLPPYPHSPVIFPLSPRPNHPSSPPPSPHLSAAHPSSTPSIQSSLPFPIHHLSPVPSPFPHSQPTFPIRLPFISSFPSPSLQTLPHPPPHLPSSLLPLLTLPRSPCPYHSSHSSPQFPLPLTPSSSLPRTCYFKRKPLDASQLRATDPFFLSKSPQVQQVYFQVEGRGLGGSTVTPPRSSSGGLAGSDPVKPNSPRRSPSGSPESVPCGWASTSGPCLSASPLCLASTSLFPSPCHSLLLLTSPSLPLHAFPSPLLSPPPIPQQPLCTPNSAFGWCEALQWRHHRSLKAPPPVTAAPDKYTPPSRLFSALTLSHMDAHIHPPHILFLSMLHASSLKPSHLQQLSPHGAEPLYQRCSSGPSVALTRHPPHTCSPLTLLPLAAYSLLFSFLLAGGGEERGGWHRYSPTPLPCGTG